MNEATHDPSLLGAYVLGALDADEAGRIDEHLASCASCRTEVAELTAWTDMLGDVPPEAFLDGPPDGSDLLLRRTLRQVRSEAAPNARWRVALVAASVAALVAAALGSGVLIGRGTVSAVAEPGVSPSVSPVPASSGPSATVPGTQVRSVTDPTTDARMTVTLIPAAGWVRVNVNAGGIKEGQRCRLMVVSRSGPAQQAGSWLVSARGERDGTSLEGTALIAPADVAAVDVVTFDGVKLVSVPF